MALQAARVTVATTATRLDTTDPTTPWNGVTVVVRCPTADIYLGPAGVTTATGFQVVAGTTFVIDLAEGEALYGVAAAASVTHVLRTSS